jgi:hypothetical protein
MQICDFINRARSVEQVAKPTEGRKHGAVSSASEGLLNMSGYL